MLHYTTIYSHLNKIKIPKIISEINGFGLLDNKTYCKISDLPPTRLKIYCKIIKIF